jgi:hypothetical protein
MVVDFHSFGSSSSANTGSSSGGSSSGGSSSGSGTSNKQKLWGGSEYNPKYGFAHTSTHPSTAAQLEAKAQEAARQMTAAEAAAKAQPPPPVDMVLHTGVTYSQALVENAATALNQQLFGGRQGVVVTGSGTEYKLMLNPNLSAMDQATRARFETVIGNALAGYQKTSEYGTFKKAEGGGFTVSQHTPSLFSYSTDTGELEVTFASGEVVPYSQLSTSELTAFGPQIETAKSEILLDINAQLGEKYQYSGKTSPQWQGGKIINLPTQIVSQDLLQAPSTPTELLLGSGGNRIETWPAFSPTSNMEVFNEGGVVMTQHATGLGMEYIDISSAGIPQITRIKFTGKSQPEIFATETFGKLKAENVSYTTTGGEVLNTSFGPVISTPIGEFFMHDYAQEIFEAPAQKFENATGLYLKTPGGFTKEIRPLSSGLYLTAGFAEQAIKGATALENMLVRGFQSTSNNWTAQEKAIVGSEIAASGSQLIEFPILVFSYGLGGALGEVAGGILGGAGSRAVLVEGATGKALKGVPEDVEQALLKKGGLAKYVEPEAKYVLTEGGVIRAISTVGKSDIKSIRPPGGKELSWTTFYETPKGEAVWTGLAKIAIPITEVGQAIEYTKGLGQVAMGEFRSAFGAYPERVVAGTTPMKIISSTIEEGMVKQEWSRGFGGMTRYIGPSNLGTLPQGLVEDITVGLRYGEGISGKAAIIKEQVGLTMNQAIAYPKALTTHYTLPMKPAIEKAMGMAYSAGRIGGESLRWGTVTGGLQAGYIGITAFSEGYSSAEAERLQGEDWNAGEEWSKITQPTNLQRLGLAKVEYGLGKAWERLQTREALSQIAGAAAGGMFLGAIEETQFQIRPLYRGSVGKVFKPEKLSPLPGEVPKGIYGAMDTFIGKPTGKVLNLVGKTAFKEEAVIPISAEARAAERIAYNEKIANLGYNERRAEVQGAFTKSYAKLRSNAAIRPQYVSAARMAEDIVTAKTAQANFAMQSYKPILATTITGGIQTTQGVKLQSQTAVKQASRLSETMAERMTTRTVQDMAERMAARQSTTLSERLTEQTATKQAARQTERLAERMAERMAVKQTTRQSERLVEKIATRIILRPPTQGLGFKQEYAKKPSLYKPSKVKDVRSLYADLISVAETEAIVGAGKARHPSILKHPELWKSETGRIPTAQQLSGQIKGGGSLSNMFKKQNGGRFL